MIDSNDIWKTSDSRLVNFSDFPTFDPNRGRAGSTIILVLSKHGPVLYAVPHFVRSVRKLRFFPVCAAASWQQLIPLSKFELIQMIETAEEEIMQEIRDYNESKQPTSFYKSRKVTMEYVLL